MRLERLVVLVAALGGCDASKPSQGELEAVLRRQEPSFAVLVGQIERYRAEQGGYPLELTSIQATPSQAEVPARYPTLRALPVRYEVARDRSYFRVLFAIEDSEDYELRAASSYLSRQGRWNTDRSMEPFAFVEAKQFGARYQRDHADSSLELAVSSLLDAARPGGYPCVNFWAGWVSESLGTGSAKSPALPDLPTTGESMVFAAKGDAVFAFAIQRKTFARTSGQPIPYVAGVYELKSDRSGWATVQECRATP